MTDRAKKFIKEHLGRNVNYMMLNLSGGTIYYGESEFATLLEQFHSQCLPTDEEIEKQYPYNTKGLDFLYADGAKWCKNFVREEPVVPKVSPTEKKEVKSCKTCAFHDVFYLDFPCIGCWDQIARIYLLWKPKSPKEPPVKENLPDEKRTCINCKYEKRPIEEACVGCGDWTNWQPKEPTLEDEINALKEPTVENATTHDLLTELIKRNLK